MAKKQTKTRTPSRVYREKEIKRQYKVSQSILAEILPPCDLMWDFGGREEPLWEKGKIDLFMKNPITQRKIAQIRQETKAQMAEEYETAVNAVAMAEKARKAPITINRYGYRETVKMANIFYSNTAHARKETFYMANPHAIVNYIRHQHTNYDALIQQFDKGEGGAEACRIIAHRIYDVIAKAYPWYQDVIEDQRTEHLQRFAGRGRERKNERYYEEN